VHVFVQFVSVFHLQACACIKSLFLATGGVLWKLRYQLQTNVVPGP
jgi:hypothetical protein